MRVVIRVAALVFATATVLASASAAMAKTYNVTRTSDPVPGNCQPNDCSLREAILAANANLGVADTIQLPNARRTYKLTIANSGGGEDIGMEGDLDVSNDRLTILHRGKGRARIDQRRLDRVIDAFAALTLKRIAVTGGGDSSSAFEGGGIHSQSPLKLIESVVARNHGDDGGALNIYDGGTLTMLRSALLRNRSDDDGGAATFVGTPPTTPITIVSSRVIGNRAGSAVYDTEHGGAIDLSTGGSRLIIRDSTFAKNHTVVEGGAIYSDNPDQITITGSTFTENGADTTGGGALYLENSDARIVNSTFSGNTTAASGGAILAMGVAEVSLNAVTVVRNLANTDENPFSETGGGLSNISTAPFTVRNSIIALNRLGPGPRNDCTGDPFASGGGNLLSTLGPAAVCDGFAAPGDLVRANPKVGTLANNGGPTNTVALRAGSPAIGNARNSSAPNRDQRGLERDSNPDSGAFERGAG